MSDPTTDSTQRTHTDYSTAGYAVLPIIPPSAELSEQSRIPADQRGKVPGVRKPDGTWVGLHGWAEAEPSPKRMARWTESGAGVGLLCGSRGGIVAVDIDVLDREVSQAIQRIVLDQTGPAPVRVGRAPKSLVLLRLREGEEVSHSKIKFTLEDGSEHLVEILGKGKQFVAEGVHPKTGRAYVWSALDPVEDYNRIPVVGRADLAELMDTIQSELMLIHGAEILSARSATGEVTGKVEQDSLKAPDLIEAERLVRALPNVDALEEVTGRAGRDHWIEVGYAIRGAFQDDPALGEELWLDWCGRWDSGSNDPDESEREWGKMVPPYRVGWGLLQRLATALSADERVRMARRVFADENEGGEDPVDELLASCVFVKTAGAYYDFRDRTLLPVDSFDRAHKRHTGKRKASTLVDVRGEPVLSLGYAPGEPRIILDENGHRHANEYRPGLAAEWIKAGPIDTSLIGPWLRLVEVVAPEPESRERFLDWLAHQIQRPGEKPGWHPALIGLPGTGKDSLLLPIIAGLGENVGTVSPHVLTEKFNSWIRKRSLIVWQEIHTGDSRDMEDRMKVYLSSNPTTIPLHIKNRDPFDYPNITSHVMMSNHEDALHLSNGERRIMVLNSGSDPGPGSEFFQTVYYPWLGMKKIGKRTEYLGPGAPSVCRWLAHREYSVEALMATAPLTESKREMMESSRPAMDVEILFAVEQARGPFARDLVLVNEVQAMLKDKLGGSGASTSTRAVGLAMKRLIREGRVREFRPRVGHHRPRVFAVRNVSKYGEMGEGVEFRDEFLGQLKRVPTGPSTPLGLEELFGEEDE